MPALQPAAQDLSAWGGMTCRIVVTRGSALEDAVARLVDLMDRVDRAASRFRPDSELRRLAPGTHRVSPLLATLVRVALDAAERTDGIVDPTVGGALLGLGYDADVDVVRSRAAGAITIRRVPGWRSVDLVDDRLTLPAGTLLDLGATAKAHAADLAAASIAADLGTGVLVSLGGDIATAGVAPEGGWQVRVQDIVLDAPQQVGLDGTAGLATSSAARRRWRTEDGSLHHLVDPATGRPARTPWRSVSVAAPTCTEANVLATAVLASAGGTRLLHASGRPARLVDHQGRVTAISAWPREVAA